MDQFHITRAQAKAVVLSIAPYAPSSIVDAVSEFVKILASYSPPTSRDETLQMCFTISLKFLDECYDGASPRAVFDSIIDSMAQDLLQPFPEYIGVSDLETRRELCKELRFRWSLYENLQKHVAVKKPSLTVNELEDYFIAEDLKKTEPVAEDVELSDECSVLDFIDGQLQFVKADVIEQNDELIRPTTTVVVLSSPTTSRSSSSSSEHLQLDQPIDPADDKQSFDRMSGLKALPPGPSSTSPVLKQRPYSYYRTFYASWVNQLSSGRRVRLLLFAGRRPRWKKLSGYDIALPWRFKCDK